MGKGGGHKSTLVQVTGKNGFKTSNVTKQCLKTSKLYGKNRLKCLSFSKKIRNFSIETSKNYQFTGISLEQKNGKILAFFG